MDMFEKTFCFRPFCTSVRKLMFLVGTVLAVINYSLDVIYAF